MAEKLRTLRSRFPEEWAVTVKTSAWLGLLVLLIALSWCVAPAVIAEREKKVSTSQLQVDPEFQPLSGVYYYDLFLNAVRVGKATISVEKDQDLYTIGVRGKTRKAIRTLFKVRYKGEVQMEASPLKPIAADIESQAGERKKEISIRFPQANRMEIRETKTKEGKTTKLHEYVLESDNFVLDPFSTIFLVRSLDWHVGMAEVFDIFTGTRQYELRLLCKSVENIEIEDSLRTAWVIQPEITTLTSPREKKLEKYSLYLSKDEQRDILMISGEPKIGNITVKMRKFNRLPDE